MNYTSCLGQSWAAAAGQEGGVPVARVSTGTMSERSRRVGYPARRSGTLLVCACVTFACAAATSWASPGAYDRFAHRPTISCVTPIGLTRNAQFTIIGTGFGTVARSATWKFIDVEDLTGKWGEESVKVSLWNNTKISISGFTYDHFATGDRVAITVWNPAGGGSFLAPGAGGGPALYTATIGSQRPCS
jgi:hypothetical protein